MAKDPRIGLISQISQLLSEPSSRIEGIQLLNRSLCRFNPQIISEHGRGWILSCINHNENENSEVYLITLANIIKSAKNHSVFRKNFVSDFLTPTIDLSLSIVGDFSLKEASMNCIVSCLINYPAFCNSYKKRIENHALSYLNTPSDTLNYAAGLVYFHSHLIGDATVDGTKFLNNITLSIRKLCATCHKIFHWILEDQIEFDNYGEKGIEAFNIIPAPIHYNAYLKLHYKVRYLKNTLNWVMILLSKGSNNKTIYPLELLNVIQRGFHSHFCLQEDFSSTESMHFAFYFIEVQIELLKLLKILIRQKETMSIPSHMITKIILDIIMQCHSCNCYLKKNLLQEHLHDVFSVWLQVRGTEVDQLMQDELVSFILMKIDSNLTEKSMEITHSTPKDKNILKTSENLPSDHSNEHNPMICFSALNILHILLDRGHPSLSESVSNNLQSFLYKSLSGILRGQVTFPFDEENCQILLYKIICSIVEQNFVKVLPPQQIVLNILQKGSYYHDEDIALTCVRSMKYLEKVFQPSSQSLHTLNNKDNLNKGESPQCSVNHISTANNNQNSLVSISDISITKKKVNPLILSNEVILISSAPKSVETDSESNRHIDGLNDELLDAGEKFNTMDKELINLTKTSLRNKLKSRAEGNEESKEDKVEKKMKI